MSRVVIASLMATAASADSEPLIQVALAPPVEGSGAAFAGFGKSEAAMESAGLSSLQKAYTSALASAKAQIDAAVHGSSFLKSPELFVRVLNGPEAGVSAARVESFENVRSDIEGKRIAQATAEFDALTKVVVAELKNALHSSFLRKGDLGVKVKASDIPWASTMDLLRGVEAGRDASEAVFAGKVLDLQTQYVKSLNGMIAAALA